MKMIHLNVDATWRIQNKMHNASRDFHSKLGRKPQPALHTSIRARQAASTFCINHFNNMAAAFPVSGNRFYTIERDGPQNVPMVLPSHQLARGETVSTRVHTRWKHPHKCWKVQHTRLAVFRDSTCIENPPEQSFHLSPHKTQERKSSAQKFSFSLDPHW